MGQYLTTWPEPNLAACLCGRPGSLGSDHITAAGHFFEKKGGVPSTAITCTECAPYTLPDERPA